MSRLLIHVLVRKKHQISKFNYFCESEVVQLCQTLCDPMDCSPPGSSVHGILQARTVEWVAISYSRGSSRLRDRTHVTCIFCTGRWFFITSTSWEALYLLQVCSNCLFLLESIFVVYAFLGIYLFHLSYLLCWLFTVFPYVPFFISIRSVMVHWLSFLILLIHSNFNFLFLGQSS